MDQSPIAEPTGRAKTGWRATAPGDLRVLNSEKANTTVAAAVEHRLSQPEVLIGVAAEFSAAANAVSVNKLGVSLTFGDN